LCAPGGGTVDFKKAAGNKGTSRNKKPKTRGITLATKKAAKKVVKKAVKKPAAKKAVKKAAKKVAKKK
jgi:hypothetical protein